VAGPGRCPSGHELAGARRSFCPACRRDEVISRVVARDTSLQPEVIAAAVDAATATPAALRSLATALAADTQALRRGAPPVVGQLVTELIARGSALPAPACAACGRTGCPLTRTTRGGWCAGCAPRAGAAECARCHAVKPVAGAPATASRSASGAAAGNAACAGAGDAARSRRSPCAPGARIRTCA
jgi:hypothetical protein